MKLRGDEPEILKSIKDSATYEREVEKVKKRLNFTDELPDFVLYANDKLKTFMERLNKRNNVKIEY